MLFFHSSMCIMRKLLFRKWCWQCHLVILDNGLPVCIWQSCILFYKLSLVEVWCRHHHLEVWAETKCTYLQILNEVVYFKSTRQLPININCILTKVTPHVAYFIAALSLVSLQQFKIWNYCKAFQSRLETWHKRKKKPEPKQMRLCSLVSSPFPQFKE